jgi:hypothetical protein
MFLLRTAFWLSLVIVLLPADSGEQAPRVTAFEALSAAQAAVSDLSQFCERNPDVCVTGGSAFEVFADKVRYGAKMISGYFNDDGAKAGSSTLKPSDVEPEWQAPPSENSKALNHAA